MEEWKIIYLNENVSNEIKNLPLKLQAHFSAITEKMEISGPNLGWPYTCSFGKGLFEMRLKAQDGIARVFFGLYEHKKIVILHSFIKKTQKTPIKELRIAKKRLKEVQKKCLMNSNLI